MDARAGWISPCARGDVDRVERQRDFNQLAGRFDGKRGHRSHDPIVIPTDAPIRRGELQEVVSAIADCFYMGPDCAINRFQVEHGLVRFHGKRHKAAVGFQLGETIWIFRDLGHLGLQFLAQTAAR